MAIDTFWTTQNSGAYDPVLDETLGDSFDAPHTYLAGALSDDALGAQLASDAAELYPVYDGATHVMAGRPSDFDNPTAESFLKWHSAHQLAWLREYGTETTIDGQPVRMATFGTDANPLNNVTVLLSQDGQSVIVVNRLSVEQIATLPLVDQMVLAGLDAFRALIADLYNLSPATGEGTSDEVRMELQTVIQNAIDQIAAQDSYTDGARDRFLNDPSSRGELYHYLFTEQLEILSLRLDRMAVFDIDTIEQSIADIVDRFTRLERYMTMTEAGTETLPTHSNGLDGGASVAAAAEVFLTIETRIYDALTQSRDLSLSGNYNGRDTDAPGLIFLFQTFATYVSEAEAEGKTEEMDQNNRLLEDYAKLQELLNETLRAFSEPGASDKVGLGGVTTLAALKELAAGNALILAMFDTRLVDADNNTMHPLEAEKVLKRPTLDLVGTDGNSLTHYTKEEWNAFATNIGEMTTLIGQDTEIRMSELTQLGEIKNRHYELGSNVLNKMNSLIQSIINI
ncbi:hypothetical protein [Celeribacter naphthalenivorans]|uniref:hypothetical protein n=1 Tax=Celeribacter naphthalenivorans TaxID=1614694 RepID=UPI001CF99731|nr:hypothetical protein [Celeribacter naphthalenivorans]